MTPLKNNLTIQLFYILSQYALLLKLYLIFARSRKISFHCRSVFLLDYFYLFALHPYLQKTRSPNRKVQEIKSKIMLGSKNEIRTTIFINIKKKLKSSRIHFKKISLGWKYGVEITAWYWILISNPQLLLLENRMYIMH